MVLLLVLILSSLRAPVAGPADVAGEMVAPVMGPAFPPVVAPAAATPGNSEAAAASVSGGAQAHTLLGGRQAQASERLARPHAAGEGGALLTLLDAPRGGLGALVGVANGQARGQNASGPLEGSAAGRGGQGGHTG